MKVGFDLDGVIIDHSALKIELARESGFLLIPEQTPSEIMKTIVPQETYRNMQLSLYNDPKNPSPLMTGVTEIFDVLQKKSVPFFLISRRKNIPVVWEWLGTRNLLKYFTPKNTFFVETKEMKNDTAKKLGITHYFDDEIGVLEKLKSVNNKFLFDKYNVFPKSDFYTKIASWEDIKTQLLV